MIYLSSKHDLLSRFSRCDFFCWVSKAGFPKSSNVINVLGVSLLELDYWNCSIWLNSSIYNLWIYWSILELILSCWGQHPSSKTLAWWAKMVSSTKVSTTLSYPNIRVMAINMCVCVCVDRPLYRPSMCFCFSFFFLGGRIATSCMKNCWINGKVILILFKLSQ